MLPRNSFKSRLILLLLFLISLVYLSVSLICNFETGETLLERHFVLIKDTQETNNIPSTIYTERIPRVIHQIYKNDTIPEKWSAAYQSCMDQNPPGNWTHILWTDDKARNFITNFYSWFLPVYDSYPYDVQRFDALRYLLLYHFGGIYLDMDVGCKKDLSALLRHHAFFGKTSPYGVSNDVMGSEKGYELFRLLVLSLEAENHYRGTKYPTVMMSTGPMFVTRVLVKFLRKKSRETFEKVPSGGEDSPVAILPPELYGMSPVSYFEHYPGSSWHGWDVWVLGQISSRPGLFVFSVFVTFAGVLYFLKGRRTRG
ncbi:mannosyl phosphorylinositol ceramide synthase SUR1 [Pochonia chlamydosporia 170]|uniref:Mannosyl phosphorylinositol ceramide synthase SUR1 n=1 Tax=Pochonia chlamydosporia 170 TaxID=1380566 RepID=A0A179F8U1_METCM|nr:mannosyl phosphorylinositol ceramide synthase SUR1 [Pochonia chlamydosporia 170]OAQ61846.1 mannosyl phosphorylinositol ceramide synthase SUR1 [Pochonia chlamydosporia 170]